jgi:poly(A) polymerase
LARISPERIADELRLILTPRSRLAAWPMLWEYGLINVIFRFLPKASEMVAETAFDGDRSLFLKLNPHHSISFPLAMAGAVFCFQWQHLVPGTDPRPLLTRDSALASRLALRKALKISNEESDTLALILESAGSLLQDTPPAVAAQKRFLASPWSSDTRLFLSALGETGWFKERMAFLQSELVKLDKTDCAPPPLITGDDLSAAGLRPGPAFKKILADVYDAQLENRVTDKAQAMRMALKVVR